MLNIQQLAEELDLKFNKKVEISQNGYFIYVDKNNIVPTLQLLKQDFGYIMLAGLTAVDYIDRYEVVYFLQKEDSSLLQVNVKLDKANAVISSIISVWKAANVQEREVFDLMGIQFEGHNNLKRVLCKDDFEGHPLRKDFKLKVVNRFKEEV